ncbi:MAG: AAA family ATPase [Alphaproteobacteria bacterium]|nr:AAA family ATPase [Alphaproteobacteria bacterium]
MSEKNFYLIAGPNGSGKTTLARELIADKKMVFLNADDIAREQNLSVMNAGHVLLNKLAELLLANESFALETTLAGNFHKKIIKDAKDNGYKFIFLYVFLSSVEQNLARIRQRVALGGHDVQEDVVRRRYTKSLLNFGAVYKIADQWSTYNNSGKQYQLFAHGVGENIEIVNSDMYKNFIERQGQISSEYMLDLANRGARKARLAAEKAGVPVVYRSY